MLKLFYFFQCVLFYFRKCISKYNAALSIVDTNEMWDKYLITMIRIISGAGMTEIHKIDLVKESLHCAHKKNKLKPNHYIHLVTDLNCIFLACTFNLYYYSFHFFLFRYIIQKVQ